MDCSILALANDDPRLCDCNQIIATDAIPLATDHPDKQKELSLKADWKYVGVVSYQFTNTLLSVENKRFNHLISSVPEQFPLSVFHPPQG
ncbi:MAG: hypothetical protein V4557_05520 [Bacteroidota bacterium]